MGNRQGFTILELVVVLAVGAVVASIAVGTFGGVLEGIASPSAQTEFLTLHAQARALAVERGTSMRFEANAESGEVRVVQGCSGAGTTLASRDLLEGYGVRMVADGGTVVVCMTARGYADPDQNSFDGEGKVAFLRGDRSLSVTLLPLGQAVRND